MTRHLAAVAPIIMLAACNTPGPTSPSAFRPQPSSGAPATPPTTFVPSPNQGPTLLPGTPIDAGIRTEVIVQGADTVCFPNWDSSGHCRQFNFAATRDGTVRVTLELPSPSRGLHDPEALLVGPDGTWDYTFDPWPLRHVSMSATTGATYRVVVISYGPFPDTLFLTVDMP